MQLNFSVFIVVVGMVWSVSATAGGLDSLRLEEKDGKYYVIHKVEKGETLYSLSRRYGANMEAVQTANGLQDINISLDQELMIPVPKPAKAPAAAHSGNGSTSSGTSHIVTAGETLYSISRTFGVTVPDLQAWNDMTGTDISVGQELLIKGGSKSSATNAGSSKGNQNAKSNDSKAVPYGYSVYYVQTGDLIETIADKFSVRPDSIVIWNNLPNTYISIGQKLMIKGKIDTEKLKKKEDVEELPYAQRRQVTDQSGFVKIYEVGSARKIDDVVETDKYLALHRDLEIGALVEVRNLMNNQKIFVRIVGKLPETGLNENVLIRMTPICFERLGVIDPKTRVEVSYYKD